MAKNYWRVVNGVISEAEIILEIIDARAVAETRNLEIEDKVKKAGKIIIYVLNKCDLADQHELDMIKKSLNPSVFISCKDYHGMNLLRERILIEARKAGIPKPVVGVLGYPNMGKSSVINALTGTGKARTSNLSGFTHGKQYVISRQFYLIDTPGVIPYGEKDAVKNAMMGIKTQSKDPESDLLSIMQEKPGLVESHYEVPVEEDKEETLEKIAMKMKCVKKGNQPDSIKAAKIILRWVREERIKM
jgi:ribosome biogenesis GTPase A